MPERITAVVINRNGGDNPGRCLKALKNSSAAFCEIILSDDDSSDGSPERAAAAHPGIRIIRTAHNSGPGQARNLALAASTGNLVFFLDCDTVPEPDAARLLAAALLSGGAAAACPQIMAGDSGLAQYGAGRCHFLGLSDFEDVFSAGGSGGVRAGYSSFSSSSFMLDRRTLPRGLEFDRDYFFYCEDTDFSLRLAHGGGRIIYEPGARVRHFKAGLSPADGAVSPDRMFYHSRNRRLTVLKNFSWSVIILGLPFHALYEAFTLAIALRQGTIMKYLAGWFSFLRLVPRSVCSRRGKRAVNGALLSFGPLPVRPAFRDGGAAGAAAGLFDLLSAGWWGLVRRLALRGEWITL